MFSLRNCSIYPLSLFPIVLLGSVWHDSRAIYWAGSVSGQLFVPLGFLLFRWVFTKSTVHRSFDEAAAELGQKLKRHLWTVNVYFTRRRQILVVKQSWCRGYKQTTSSELEIWKVNTGDFGTKLLNLLWSDHFCKQIVSAPTALTMTFTFKHPLFLDKNNELELRRPPAWSDPIKNQVSDSAYRATSGSLLLGLYHFCLASVVPPRNVWRSLPSLDTWQSEQMISIVDNLRKTCS